MRKTAKLNWLIMAAFAAIVFVSSNICINAQPAEKVFKVGDRVEANLADLANNSPDNWQKGTIKEIYYSEGKIFSYLITVDSLGYAMQFKNYARVIRVSQTADGGEKTTVNNRQETPSDTTNPPKDTSDGETDDNADCSFEKYPAVEASDKFSNSLIKSVLYERYASQANTGSLTSPGEIGVTFLKIQIGKSYTNTVTVVPGRGAQRKQDGAPVDAAIYPFKAVYIVCQKYAKENVKKRYESDFVCFKDNKGNWNCPVDGVPKITYPK